MQQRQADTVQIYTWLVASPALLLRLAVGG